MVAGSHTQFPLTYICNLQLMYLPHRDLRRIRRHLDLESEKLLANAPVSSCLDYCNSVLSGIAETDLTKFQRVSNRLARVVTNSPPFTRSVPLPCSLHWLPVKYRVHFSICWLTYRALHEEQPVYLRSFIATSLPSHSLRSNRGITLSVPRIRTNICARAFSSCSPSLWNNLPLSVRSATSVATFRRRLKTYLFDLAFPPVDTGVPNGLLRLRNDFNDFEFEHWSGCCPTEPGYAGDIGAIEIWLIDWLIDWLLGHRFQAFLFVTSSDNHSHAYIIILFSFHLHTLVYAKHSFCLRWYQSINQSINQSKLYSTNIPRSPRLSDATAESVTHSTTP